MGKQYTSSLYRTIPILDAARRCGLVLNDRTLEWEEVEASCPFCGDHGPGKYHLFLNTRRLGHSAHKAELIHIYIVLIAEIYDPLPNSLSDSHGRHLFPAGKRLPNTACKV